VNTIKNKTFFVTGGAGFIGSNMVETLVERGASVIVYDNLSSGKYEFLKHLEGNKKFKFIKADLLDKDRLEAAMREGKPDAVIHMAANPDVRRGAVETDLDLKQGTFATYNVLESMRKNGVKEILFSSSSVVYGIADKKPTREDYGPLLPISLYGSSKLASEGLITAFANLNGMRYFIYRFANVVGRNGTHGVVIDFIKKLRNDPNVLEVLGDGKQRKSYIGVMECVEAMLYVYENSKSEKNLYNIAADDQISVKEIAETVRDRISKGAKIKYTGGKEGWPGDVPDAYLDNSKLKKFGYSPKRGSREVIEMAITEILKAM
jgi:UDP-glucose 4-epimerase